MPAPEFKPIHVRRFPVDLWRRFCAHAKVRGVTVRDLLATVLTTYLQEGDR